MQIIDFYAQWCGQCKKIMPIIDELSKEYNVLKVDVETDRDMAIKYNINSLPTILFIKDNKEIGRISGLVSKKMIIDKIDEVITMISEVEKLYENCNIKPKQNGYCDWDSNCPYPHHRCNDECPYFERAKNELCKIVNEALEG